MTIDKIKYYMDPIIFNFWVNCRDQLILNKACLLLKKEIDNKLLIDIKYFAELYLLKSLLK